MAHMTQLWSLYGRHLPRPVRKLAPEIKNMERLFKRCAGVGQVLQSTNDVVVRHIALLIVVLVNCHDTSMGSRLAMQLLEITAVVRHHDASIRDGKLQMLSVR